MQKRQGAVSCPRSLERGPTNMLFCPGKPLSDFSLQSHQRITLCCSKSLRQWQIILSAKGSEYRYRRAGRRGETQERLDRLEESRQSGYRWRVGQIQRVRDRWRDEQTGSLQKGEKRTESQLGRRQKMRPTGGRQIKAGSGQRGKDRREGQQDKMAGGGPLRLSLFLQGLEELPELQVDPVFRRQHKSLNEHGPWRDLVTAQGEARSGPWPPSSH